jgi:hypothetical protein
VLGIERVPEQPTDAAAGRGTIFHERFKGEKAIPFVDDGHLLLRVWCREQAGKLDRDIRDGLAVTIEADNAVVIYDEIRVRLMQAVGLAARLGNPGMGASSVTIAFRNLLPQRRSCLRRIATARQSRRREWVQITVVTWAEMG